MQAPVFFQRFCVATFFDALPKYEVFVDGFVFREGAFPVFFLAEEAFGGFVCEVRADEEAAVVFQYFGDVSFRSPPTINQIILFTSSFTPSE